MDKILLSPKAAILDIDGTTLDTPHAQHTWLKYVAERFGGVTPFPEFDAKFRQDYNDWLARAKMPGLYAMVGVDYEGNRDAIHQEYDLFNQTHPIEFIPGMPEAIQELRGLGLKIGVNTTKNMRSISAPLARSGLVHLIDAYVTEDDILAQAERTGLPKMEFAKPHGYSADLIHKKLGVTANEAFALEDDTIGVRTYRNSGARPRVIAVTWGYEPSGERLKEAGADFVIDRVESFIPLVRRL